MNGFTEPLGLADGIRMDSAPIFICGPSRSGTAMLRASLNRHPKVHLAGETHFFEDLRQSLRAPTACGLTEEQARRASSYFAALSHRPYGHQGNPAKGSIQADAIRSLAEQLDGSVDAYFRAYCELEAKKAGKSVWGEKTPRHIFRIDDILASFPSAKILCMVRDPRAIVASYRDWRNQGGFDFASDPGHLQAIEEEHERTRQSYHPVTISLLWRAQSSAAHTAFRKYGKDTVRIVKYEDVIERPEREIRQICEWLQFDYSPDLLQVPMHNSSYSSFEENQGIRSEAISRWRDKLAEGEVQLIQRICKSGMRTWDYDCDPSRAMTLQEMKLWLTWPVAIKRAITANRRRRKSLTDFVWRRVRHAIRSS